MSEQLYSVRAQCYQLKERLWSIMKEYNSADYSYNFSSSKIIQPCLNFPLESAIKKLHQHHSRIIFNIYQDKNQRFNNQESYSWISQPGLEYYFDLIELLYNELSEKTKISFRDNINSCLFSMHPKFLLSPNGLIKCTPPISLPNIPEKNLRQLIQRAVELHRLPEETSRKEAVEKIWDALERLKTYYAEEPKKASAQQLIQNISGGQEEIRALLDEEFQKLTKIGNTFFIRHSETDQIIPADIRHYDYFFNRCLSLILLTIPYLEESEASHDGL